MRKFLVSSVLFAAAFGIAPVAYAAQPVSFRSIEYNYVGADRLTQADGALDSAIPAGTPLTTAEAVLNDAGAQCRPSHQDAQVIKCLYHEVSTADEYVDDIRWTTTLRVAGGNVSDVTVAREVDRH